jgi:hypothetical protein
MYIFTSAWSTVFGVGQTQYALSYVNAQRSIFTQPFQWRYSFVIALRLCFSERLWILKIPSMTAVCVIFGSAQAAGYLVHRLFPFISSALVLAYLYSGRLNNTPDRLRTASELESRLQSEAITNLTANCLFLEAYFPLSNWGRTRSLGQCLLFAMTISPWMGQVVHLFIEHIIYG